MAPKQFEKVEAFPEGDKGLVGFVLSDGAGEGGKHSVQVGDKTYPLTYREPANYDEHGPGGTFKKIG